MGQRQPVLQQQAIRMFRQIPATRQRCVVCVRISSLFVVEILLKTYKYGRWSILVGHANSDPLNSKCS